MKLNNVKNVIKSVINVKKNRIIVLFVLIYIQILLYVINAYKDKIETKFHVYVNLVLLNKKILMIA